MSFDPILNRSPDAQIDAALRTAQGWTPTKSEISTILLADDDQGVRQFCAEILAEHGYRVLEAANGRYALEIAAACQWPIDLLLSDIMMPELDGPGLAKTLRAIHSDIRVVFMSADRGGTKAALTDGDRFLHKPFSPDTLIQAVQDVLAGAHSIPENV